MSQTRVFCVSDNLIISPSAVSRLHNSLQLYSISQNPKHLNAHSIVTIDNQENVHTARFITQNDLCNKTTWSLADLMQDIMYDS